MTETNLIGNYKGRYYRVEDDKLICQLCPRFCSLKDGDRGFCFVRQNVSGQMILTTYGLSSGFCIDPVEKKPLNHFYPNSKILSFGTAGCNLGCQFCQNWSISKSREVEKLSAVGLPEQIASSALANGCRSVAFTYNDPVIWAEYAIDTAKECHKLGLKTVAVTAGYITAEARPEFYEHMDAANIDLKAFTDEFYNKLCLSQIEPVKDTIKWVKKNTDTWLEITNLIIPTKNDDTESLKNMCQWLLEAVGEYTPIHFTAFHADFRMQDLPSTPKETLLKAWDIAYKSGLKYVYVGNVLDETKQNTYCPNCSNLLISRQWHKTGVINLNKANCNNCNFKIHGVFD